MPQPNTSPLLTNLDEAAIRFSPERANIRWNDSRSIISDPQRVVPQLQEILTIQGFNVPENGYVRAPRTTPLGNHALSTCCGVLIDGITTHCFMHIAPQSPSDEIAKAFRFFPEDINQIVLAPGGYYSTRLGSRALFAEDAYFEKEGSRWATSEIQEPLIEVICALRTLGLIDLAKVTLDSTRLYRSAVFLDGACYSSAKLITSADEILMVSETCNFLAD